MLNIKGPEAELGVIIARFQTPYLTNAHRDLIATVINRHQKVAILIGVSPLIPSRKNPLDYMTRCNMVLNFFDKNEFANCQIFPIADNRSDKIWSANVDQLLRLVYPHEKIVLYGSRDSFIQHYTGKFETVELDEILGITATEVRTEAFHEIRNSEDFRRGVCYATANQYRKNVLTVDVAIIDKGKSLRVLLAGREADEGLFRFVGGHVNVGIEMGESAARREVHEETQCSLGEVEYLGAVPIDDWKYNDSGDSVFTIFYIGHYAFGPVIPPDDIDSLTWHELANLQDSQFVPEHRILFKLLQRRFLSGG